MVMSYFCTSDGCIMGKYISAIPPPCDTFSSVTGNQIEDFSDVLRMVVGRGLKPALTEVVNDIIWSFAVTRALG